MIFYTSDTHFGHSNIIRFCNRPWKTVADMDRDMIAAWNARVADDDHVWHLGDFCYRNAADARSYLRALNGHKHLVIGNHDHKGVLRLGDELGEFFESVDYAACVQDGDRRIWMSHYPLAEPPKHVWCLYGHVHGNKGWDGYKLVRGFERCLNACADVNNYVPVTFDELVYNNRIWKGETR